MHKSVGEDNNALKWLLGLGLLGGMYWFLTKKKPQVYTPSFDEADPIYQKDAFFKNLTPGGDNSMQHPIQLFPGEVVIPSIDLSIRPAV